MLIAAEGDAPVAEVRPIGAEESRLGRFCTNGHPSSIQTPPCLPSVPFILPEVAPKGSGQNRQPRDAGLLLSGAQSASSYLLKDHPTGL